MANLLKSSIGKKLIMSLSGLFLMVFLVVHLSMNLLLLDSSGELYNKGAHFMATNPMIRIMEPILGLGLVLHIVYSLIITISNRKARGSVDYASGNESKTTSWASKNMFVLGMLVFIFLEIHLSNFYFKMKFGEMPKITLDGEQMDDAYGLVSQYFSFWWYDIIYIFGGLFLALHLHHAFWSAFQTIGMSNNLWQPRLMFLGHIYTAFIGGGFILIPTWFMIKSM